MPRRDRYVSTDTPDTPDTDAVSLEPADTLVVEERITDDIIRTLDSAGWSMNQIARHLTGTQAKRLARIRAAIEGAQHLPPPGYE
jgi:hypothetical protein